MAIRRAVVDKESVGMRLDLFLARRFSRLAEPSGLSRSGIQKMISGGQVTLNGRKSKPSTRLKLRDLIQVDWVPPEETSLLPERIALDILYEDDDFIAVNKPAGMVVHPAAGKVSGTLVNALLYHCPSLEGIGGERRPGIVHRLDKYTSGVMVVAKRDYAFRRLAQQFKDRCVQKEYLSLVWGKVDRRAGMINRPIGRHRADRKRMSSVRALSQSREAITEWTVEKTYKIEHDRSMTSWVTLLRLRPRTGRTHQIRVHLADFGYPIVGDKVYGRKRQNVGQSGVHLLKELVQFPRQALHAHRLGFRHPRTNAMVQFCAPLSADMEELLGALDGAAINQETGKVQRGVDKETVFS